MVDVLHTIVTITNVLHNMNDPGYKDKCRHNSGNILIKCGLDFELIIHLR